MLPLSGCFGNKFTNDPVKWTYVSGDGSWDIATRNWPVYLSPGESKSIKIRLYNSSDKDTFIFTVPVGPTDLISLSSQERFPLRAGVSAEITLTTIANSAAASGSHRYVIKYGSSFYGPADFKDISGPY